MNNPQREHSFRVEKSHIIICLIAAFSITAGFIIRILMGYPFGLFTMALWVSAVIVVFYCLGAFVRAFLINNVFAPPEADELEATEISAEFMEEAPLENSAYDDVMLEEPMLDSAIYTE